MDDYNEDFFDDDNQVSFRLERNAFERMGYEDLLGLGGPVNLKKSGYSDIDKFKLITLATIVLINDIFDGNIDHSSTGGNDYTFDNSEIKYGYTKGRILFPNEIYYRDICSLNNSIFVI